MPQRLDVNFEAGERTRVEWACVKLVYEFGRLMDAREYDALVELFAEDAEFNRPSEPKKILRGRNQLLADFKARPSNQVTTHLFSNVQVTARTGSHATGFSYLIMYTGTTENVGPVGVPFANREARIGAFTEEFVCRNGIWLFQRRSGRMLLVVGGQTCDGHA